MATSFTCLHCGLENQLTDNYTGVWSRCTRCGTTHTMKDVSCPRASVAVILFCAGILAVVLPPLIQTIRENAQQAQCADQMKELGVAMHNYYYEHDSFPPAYLVDKDGKPKHSWRVLLLPWLGEKGLYNEYRFEEPWNSPHNMAIGKKLGGYFHCPSDSDASSTETSYMMLVGPGMISDGTSATRFADMKDGSFNTILLVEVTHSGVYWWEPSDLDASQMSFQINSASGTEIGSRHPGTANVLMCAGHISSISDDTAPEQIRGMSTIAGGERMMPVGGGR